MGRWGGLAARFECSIMLGGPLDLCFTYYLLFFKYISGNDRLWDHQLRDRSHDIVEIVNRGCGKWIHETT